jgi:integrase
MAAGSRSFHKKSTFSLLVAPAAATRCCCRRTVSRGTGWLAWATALYAGLRRGELQALHWHDIDLTTNIISVRHSWDDKARLTIAPKSAAGHRSVPIAATLRSQLTQHRLRSGSRELAFATGDTPFIATTASRRATAAWQAARLQPISFHEARHTAAHS